MIKLDKSYQRICWLIFNDLKSKKYIHSMIFLSCFGILSFLFFNKTFTFSSLIDLIFNPSQQVTTFSSRTITYYSSDGPFTQNLHFLKYHLEYFPKALYVVGFIITSLSFMEYGEISSRRFYISLPATRKEKWFSKLIISTFIFPILFLVIYQLFALITYQWGTAKGLEYVKLHFFDPYIWKHMRLYMLAQSFVLLGSVFFRKYSLIKILLVTILLYFLVIIVINVSMVIMLPDLDMDHMDSYINRNSYLSYITGNRMSIKVEESQFSGINWTNVIITIMALFALFLSYMRFKELEG